MLIICPTADYELYLGRNLLPFEKVLFEPTDKVLDLWQQFDLRGTLFPDICSAWRHREIGMIDFAERFEAQLRHSASAGHDIQLHLHPEWLRARHDDSTWQFQPNTGSLHDLGFDPDDPHGAPALIRRGRDYLESLIGPLQPGYRCLAFRAGGWILQPEGLLVRALLAAGIRVDATVIPGARLLRTDYSIDFRNVPDRTHWFFDSEHGLSVDSGATQGLLEIPIGAYRGSLRPWHHALSELRLRRRKRYHPEPSRGFPMGKIGPPLGPIARLERKYRKLTIPRMLDLADTHEAMLATVRSYLRRYDCAREEHVVCMNGHPKDTYDFHLVEARRFLDIVTTRYHDLVRFESIAEYYKRAFDR